MPEDEVDSIVVVGQRRRYQSDPFPDRGLPDPPLPGQNAELPPDSGPGMDDPCADPDKKREWDIDAAAAEAVREFQRRAAERGEDLNTREWGAPIWQGPNGEIEIGPIAYSEYTFLQPGPGGQGTVQTSWNTPPGWRIVGVVHTHFAGGHLPSGLSHNEGDQAGLTYMRSLLGADANLARIYIAALTTGPAGHQQRVKINVYNHLNRDAAINQQQGPEVNPEGLPCPG